MFSGAGRSFLPDLIGEGGQRIVDLAEGLQHVVDAGAPAQAQRAHELIVALHEQAPTPDTSTVRAAEELVRAFLHDPDLWR